MDRVPGGVRCPGRGIPHLRSESGVTPPNVGKAGETGVWVGGRTPVSQRRKGPKKFRGSR